MRTGSLPQGLDDQPCCAGSGVLLLPGNQQAVPHRVRPETAMHDEVALRDVPCLVLDAPVFGELLVRVA